MYFVYVHTVPNGKVYIGEAKYPMKRWNNGEGYIENKPFYNDIQAYGWSNIKHEIIATVDDKNQAEILEAVLITILKSENESYGYNQTNFYNSAMKKYVTRKKVDGVSFEKDISENSFFEASNLPVSACEDMINQWIFNEEHRKILKSRLIDGLSYSSLSERYKKSVRQLKNIVYDGCDKLEKHF